MTACPRKRLRCSSFLWTHCMGPPTCSALVCPGCGTASCFDVWHSPKGQELTPLGRGSSLLSVSSLLCPKPFSTPRYQKYGAPIPHPQITSCVTLGKSLNLSEPSLFSTKRAIVLVNTYLRAGLNMTSMCRASALLPHILFPSLSAVSVQFLVFYKIRLHFYLTFLPELGS